MSEQLLQWLLVLLSGIAFFFITPLSKTASEFFAATDEKGKQPGLFMLTASLIISWIFAKSITNAANLGLEFGIVGGVAYAVYYLSFLVAGVVIYQLRTRGGFTSIHHFLQSKFGRTAVVIFSILIAFRLFNEVWSNTMVIGSYFGAAGTTPYYASILVFTGLTLAYTLKGGLRSSLLTDAIQMVLFGVLLFIILGLMLPAGEERVGEYLTSGVWTCAGGLNLLFAAFIQIFSYPFHDSVMTDRGFISSPKTTLRSFVLAAVIGFGCLVTFSFVGVFARFQGMEGQAAVEVGKVLGTAVMLAMNFIMVTSAASTLDSAFSSFAKLAVIDLGNKKLQTVTRGRWMMVILTLLGTLPIFMNPEILSATTVSGTMVMGLAPVFLLWKIDAPPLSYFLAVGAGIVIGIAVAVGVFPQGLVFTEGRYSVLLAANVWGILLCFVLFLLPVFVRRNSLR